MPGIESRRERSSACRGRYGPPGAVSTRARRVRPADACPCGDLFHDGTLRVGVVLDELPVLFEQLALRGLVQGTVVAVASEPIAEAHHAPDFGTAVGEDMEVDVRVGTLDDPTVVPVRLLLPDHDS